MWAKPEIVLGPAEGSLCEQMNKEEKKHLDTL